MRLRFGMQQQKAAISWDGGCRTISVIRGLFNRATMRFLLAPTKNFRGRTITDAPTKRPPLQAGGPRPGGLACVARLERHYASCRLPQGLWGEYFYL